MGNLRGIKNIAGIGFRVKLFAPFASSCPLPSGRTDYRSACCIKELSTAARRAHEAAVRESALQFERHGRQRRQMDQDRMFPPHPRRGFALHAAIIADVAATV